LSTLKQKTISGLLWSAIDNVANNGIGFVVGVILARLLSPEEFGLIGMTTVFIAISSTFISSGFSQALIRKQDCTNKDYSTIFFFNITVAFLFYGILFLTAPYISRFFNEPRLTLIIQVISIGLIIESVTIIQSVILSKRVDFKLLTKISFISLIISGVIGIVMAYKGFGVWSLVYRNLINQITRSLLLWTWNKWRPSLEFSLSSLKELFSFGSRLLVNGIIDNIYNNVYYLVIGKYFSAKELGYYSRADMFSNLPSRNILTVIYRVSYPVLSKIQENPAQLKSYYKKMISSTMLISFLIMISMAALAEPIIISLIGEKWRPAITYLQMLSFVGMLTPLQSLNTNLVLVLGRSDIFLRLEIFKKLLAVPIIILGIFFGIKIMILGMIINSIIGYFFYSYWSGKFINYSIKEQLIEIIPGFLVAVTVGFVIIIIKSILPFNQIYQLILLTMLGGVSAISLYELFKIRAYLFLKQELIIQLNKLKK
jgi:teichuronic acid exporter